MTKMDMTKRMETLKANGFDTANYFNLHIDKDLPKGTTLTITIGEDGTPEITEMLQGMLKQIEDDGYVKSSSLFRRWVMAQTFRMMRENGGYTGALNRKPYKYQWEMLENELHAMSKIEKEDEKQFNVRKDFFTKEVIIEMLRDFQREWESKAEQYKYYTNMKNIAVSLAQIAIRLLLKVGSYVDYYQIIKKFNKAVKEERVQLPKKMVKSKAWVDAYKGAGAYYSLDNMIKYSLDRDNIMIPVRKVDETMIPRRVNRMTALMVLEQKRMEYKGEWWKLFGFFKEVVKLNNFNFEYEMYKKYHTSIEF